MFKCISQQMRPKMLKKDHMNIGLGLWKIPNDQCAETVYRAIEAGYRHLDSACDYGNEIEVGHGITKALADGLCSREELTVTSKLWNTYHAPEHVQPALEKILSDLNLDYLDSFLIHFPIAQAFVPFEERYPPEWLFDPSADNPVMKLSQIPLSDTWGAMEKLVDQKLVKQIGVCNYNSGLLHDLMSYASIKPAELQIESHPYLSQESLIRLAKNYGIAVTAFSPFGALSYIELEMAGADESVLSQQIITQCAEKYNKTPAQIVLRWGIQRGCSVITKTTKTERLVENISIFDFELTASEMAEISALNKNRRFNDPGKFCESAFNTFYPIYD